MIPINKFNVSECYFLIIAIIMIRKIFNNEI